MSDCEAALHTLDCELMAIAEAADEPLRAGLAQLVAAGGKRLRPQLAYLCWHMGGGHKLAVLPLMTMLELMHTASLIHDDVVDGASLRRGVPALHILVGERAAVQGADYLLSAAMERLHVYRGTGINEILTQVSLEMCRGELWQREAICGLSEQTEQSYFTQIRRKTASLIAAACRCGAVAGGAEQDMAERLWCFGESFGIAFQLRDDLMDFCGDESGGKPAGLDAKAGVLTLPALRRLAGETQETAVKQTEAAIASYTAMAAEALSCLHHDEAQALCTLAGVIADHRG